ncbi:large-conductance mechanosensitive channel protein MscL [Erysipelothrix sp. HDW6C]|uniref:large-conductance mechanosensitive channel protein MscL n=1 Tax=Erysipelothrix sp. HDW6C TaxID=2714930 RepID=UPI00140D1718|nr:large-conductance mechanosensitive channel protein MscL [Erysipelothrix sp. HDW6C]QIK70004.1 large-conductance mechanosensitive channel protein MscL [Erysipelothrix sp. HDW6C]
MKNFIKEFKEFAMQGNVIDMAVGVVIGGAFGKIVSSLVADIIMPIIGLITGGGSFDSLKLVLRDDSTNPLTLNYGAFLQNTVDFIIIAACIFVAVKLMNKLLTKKSAPAVDEAPAEPSEEVKLLKDILKELKKQK